MVIKMRNFVIGLTSVFALQLSACSEVPDEAYFTRGQPESLLSVNTESVSVDLNQRNAAAQIAKILSGEEASRAVLSCSNAMVCQRAERTLNQYKLPYEIVQGQGNSVSIIYDRIVMRECDNRFVTNHNNPYNLNHRGFGCSIAMNQALAVKDKRQFTDPLVLGPYDGFKAAQNYDNYLARQDTNRVIQAQPESTSGGQ